MCKSDVVRAWKDEDYRLTLSEEEQRMLPTNPAGLIEISDSQLGAVGGGAGPGDLAPGYYSCFGLCNSEFLQICSGFWAPCTGDFFCPIFPISD